MNYCEKCGKEILETDIYCPHCGNKVINPKKNKNQRPLEIAVISFLVLSIVFSIFVIPFSAISNFFDFLRALDYADTERMIINMLQFVLSLIYIISILWKIPALVIVIKSFNKEKPIGLGFKIFTTIFFGFIPGILLLCHKEPEQ